MQTALIYSHNFDGHRQVYVFVIAHVLSELGFKIIIAGDFSANHNNSFYIDKLDENKSIIKVNTCEYAGFGMNITNSEFVDLQEKYDVKLTVFAEADNHIPLLISQILPNNKRFRGRIVGIFLRPWYFYRKLSFINKIKYIKNLSKTWRSDNRLFHEILNSNFNLLDYSMHIDEYFVSNHKKYLWLPDVFQQYADTLIHSETSDQRIWVKLLDDFIQINKNCFILLYFGTAQRRRGYDQLLKLAIDNNACFVHCGLRNDDEKYMYDVQKLRSTLFNENKLFETNQYITDPYCIEYFFKSVTHLVLPYIDSFLGSSGVMHQALSYGIPVLVRDTGLIGYQVKKYNLGFTFNESSILDVQFRKFIEVPKENFIDSIKKYMSYQSVNQLNRSLIDVFINKKPINVLPIFKVI